MSPDQSSLDFDALCTKIAEGKASPEEVKLAFQMLNHDIDVFSADVQAQLTAIKNNL